MDPHLVERALVKIIVDMIESGKLAPRIRTHKEFANLTFPSRGEKFWKSVRIGQNDKPPQSMPLECAVAAANSLGLSLVSLLVRAEILVEEGFDQSQDTCNNRPPSRRRGAHARVSEESSDSSESAGSEESAQSSEPTSAL
ncbi:MAG: hypothetical protein IJU76_11380 [Desulfovibrionaceae bacterium]|nr:hypothetical protein [Desulfovibrionaceae bacterium]